MDMENLNEHLKDRQKVVSMPATIFDASNWVSTTNDIKLTFSIDSLGVRIANNRDSNIILIPDEHFVRLVRDYNWVNENTPFASR